jgi:putative adenylate-forming enzyme
MLRKNLIIFACSRMETLQVFLFYKYSSFFPMLLLFPSNPKFQVRQLEGAHKNSLYIKGYFYTPDRTLELSATDMLIYLRMINYPHFMIFSVIETNFAPLFYFTCKYRFNHASRKDIENYQLKKARKVAKYAVKNSKYYRNLYRGRDLNDVWSLPTTNKKVMMENLTDFNTAGLTKKEILDFCLEVEKSRDFSRRLKGISIGMSSGTSGNKGVEITTPREERYLKAALFSRFNFPKKEKVNLAFILRVSSPAFNLNLFGHKLTYVSQLNSIGNIVQQLEKIGPNVVSAPPSMLEILAKELTERRLRIRPQMLISYAEILYPETKKYLKDIFGCPISEIYKCTEGAIAISCKNGNLHINEDLVAVQLLNFDGTPTKPGEPSHKMIVTDLHKTSQPIIRYELNDIITVSQKPCGCGSHFRVIEKIEGRSDDLFWGKRKGTEENQFIFPDYIRRAIITASDKVEDYQAIQKNFDEVLVRIDPKPKSEKFELIKKIEDNIKEVFSSYKCENPKIQVVFEKPSANEHSGKLIRIHREFKI